MGNKVTFSFGKNWQEFLKTLDDQRIEEAKESLCEFLGVTDLKGKTFLDIGNGSGLFSLAALRLGAERVVSFDYDPFSVKCATYLREQEGSPSHWEVMEGSALDEAFLNRLGSFDIVYSWGVLHHTGDMWRAIKNTAKLTKPGGVYYITIYNTVHGVFGSRYWLFFKKIYNNHPWFGRCVMEPLYVVGKFAVKPLKGQNPLKIIRDYKIKYRGMSWRRDITDWLGGYPYEFASVQEIFAFMKKHYPTYRLVNVKSSNYMRPNWFLFKREEGSESSNV